MAAQEKSKIKQNTADEVPSDIAPQATPKISLFKKCSIWLKTHKKQMIVTMVTLFVVGAGLGGVFAYKQYQRQTIEYAVETLNEAIALRDLEKLNATVDFKRLSQDFVMALDLQLLSNEWSKPLAVNKLFEQAPAKSGANVQNAALANEKEHDTYVLQRMREDAMQQLLFKAFTQVGEAKPAEGGAEAAAKPASGGAESGTAHPAAEDEEKIPPYKAYVEKKKHEEVEKARGTAKIQADFRGSRVLADTREVKELGAHFNSLIAPPIVPDNFVAQLAATPFTVLSANDETAVLTTRVKHPVLNLNVPLNLMTRKLNGEWVVVSVANADEIIRAYRKSLNDFYDYKEAVFYARNAAIREVMYTHCVITDCTVAVTALTQGTLLHMVITMEGSNTNKEPVHNATLLCSIINEQGTVVQDSLLQLARQVNPGESFRQYWNFDIEPDTPEYTLFKQARTLVCAPAVLTVSLAKGPLLFPRPYEELAGKRP